MPLFASSNLPGLLRTAPVKAPCSNPKSSDSSSSPGNAAQFTFTNGWLRRLERRWIIRATTSLPTPLSPQINTGTSTGAICSNCCRIRTICGLAAKKLKSSVTWSQ